jgi:protein involved in polysaccharide export with SLBB domain
MTPRIPETLTISPLAMVSRLLALAGPPDPEGSRQPVQGSRPGRPPADDNPESLNSRTGPTGKHMDVGKGWSSGQAPAGRAARGALALALCLLAGCALGRPHLDEALLADAGRAGRNQGVADHYLVGCPDVLDVTVEGHPEWTRPHTVKADGRIGLAGLGRARVEGLTVLEVSERIAERTGVPAGAVRVRVAEYNSQQVYLVGEVTGLQRAVAYQGPETVLDLLQRTGGITPGAAPGEVHVIRPGVAEGRSPEVFHIDLQAVVLQRDQRTNVRLQPFDQVYVGESRQSCFAKCVPPCLRSLYDSLWGMRRQGDDKVTR